MNEQPLQILLVDDNPIDRELVQIYLRKVSGDLHLCEAESASEAIALMQSSPIDCILSDYQMPEMDGLEFLNYLRTSERDVAFIFLTGQGNEQLAADALRAGADDYFTKDRSFALYERLYHSIQRVVDSRRLHRQQRQLEAEHRHRLNELKALFTLSEGMRAELDLRQLANKALEGILSAAAPDFAMIFLRSDDSLDLIASGPPDSRFAHADTPRHKVGECMCGLAISGGKSLYSSDIRNDPRCTWTECRKAGLVSFAALPLLRGQEAIGVVGLASATPRDFEPQSPFLETVTSTVAGAVINALRFEELQRRYHELEEIAGAHIRDKA